jgi:hypothetical protein
VLAVVVVPVLLVLPVLGLVVVAGSTVQVPSVEPPDTVTVQFWARPSG